MKAKGCCRLRCWIWGFGFLAVASVALAIFTTNPWATSYPIPAADRIQPSPELLRGHVQKLVDIHPHRSNEDWSAINRAADYIKSEWAKMGFQVEEQAYDVHGKTARNLVVKIITPGVEKEPWLVLGAHYDVCMDLPGADDNASGVAGLLEVSRALAQRKPKLKRPVQLVAYTLEEPPYYDTEWMGSYVHAKRMKQANEKVGMMISLEMIGFFKEEPNTQEYPVGLLKLLYPTTGNFIAIVGHTGMWGDTRRVKAQMTSSTDIDVRSINTFGIIPGIDWSDHRSYWAFDYPAVMISDTSFFRTPNYHQATDTVDTLNYERMAQVVQGTYGIVTGF